MRVITVTALLLAISLAGCLSGNDGGEIPDGGTVPGRTESSVPGTYKLTLSQPTFSDPIIFDDVRAGGEPVIAQLPTGTLLISTHPGWTHYHPGDDPTATSELLIPANGQSYLWRSTDNGQTWVHVDLVEGVANAPRSGALGVSDPEFTVLDDGAVCMTDLIALAESSVSCSQDDGLTWGPGNSAASEGPNDRQWLASTGTELYFVANYLAPDATGQNVGGQRIMASNDYGLTWEIRGNVPCSQDLVSNPHTDHLIVSCTGGLAVSEDGGRTWSDIRRFAGYDQFPNNVPRIMAEPAIDAAGNTWIVTSPDEKHVYLIGSPDEGLTWPWTFDVGPHFAEYALDNPHGADFDVAEGNGTFVWPWVSAGSNGRVAVTWIGSYNNNPSDAGQDTFDDLSGETDGRSAGPFYVFTAYFLDATTNAPIVNVNTLTPEPMHVQPICQSGTTCQASSMSGYETGDRRLGDFFETTISADGFLHATWSNTAAEPEDVVSHAQYARQIGGIRLLTADDIGVYTPTQG